MSSIPLINELAKLKVTAEAGGGAGGSLHTLLTPVGGAKFRTSSVSTSFRSWSGSSQYVRLFNHGDGQFSVANYSYADAGTTNTQFFVQPFTVNQTTGAVTVGSSSTFYNNSSNASSNTVCWGQAGSYGFGYAASFNGSSGGSWAGTPVAWTVSGNSVTNSAWSNLGNSWWSSANGSDTYVGMSGNTAYVQFNAYNPSGRASRLNYTWNGSSWSNTNTGELSSWTSTSKVAPVASPFGTTRLGSAPGGTIRTYYNSNGYGTFLTTDVFGNDQTTFSQGSLFGANYAGEESFVGFYLSSGRTIFYGSYGHIVLKNGSNLTNLTGQVELLPVGNSFYFGVPTPYREDAWYIASDRNPYELIKVHINPTTYETTYEGSLLLSTAAGGPQPAQLAMYSGSPCITGTTQQFIVMCIPNNNSGADVTIRVVQNPLAA